MDKKLLEFISFLAKFQEVERVIYIRGKDRWENDAEHSYQMAMVAWYIISSQNLDLSIERVVLLCLAHDLVEVYAGDTFFFDDEKIKTKKAREAAAFERIKKEFSNFPQLAQTITEYEESVTKEAKFALALDKIIPVINIYLDEGRLWKEQKLTLANLRERKDEIVAQSPAMDAIWQKIVAQLEKSPELFKPPS